MVKMLPSGLLPAWLCQETPGDLLVSPIARRPVFGP
jgi:hypothetical protein